MVGFLRKTFDRDNAISAREQIKEAVAYFVVLTIYANGTVDDREVRTAMGSLARCALFANNTNDDDFDLLQRMEKKFGQNAEGNAAHYAQILEQDDWKFTAVAIMADVMLADGEADADEMHLILHLASQLTMSEAEVENTLSTLRALRRPWHA